MGTSVCASAWHLRGDAADRVAERADADLSRALALLAEDGGADAGARPPAPPSVRPARTSVAPVCVALSQPVKRARSSASRGSALAPGAPSA
ncbi:hypothetical protein CMS2648 [Clavibacter sepedonicus]|uniref:Uncharacterized protein n=1 Tax=Clavibacter sepedonicus TaxID=31964 RepID=B0RIT8_CLASE|nr:hypothetical protein CMS2648 [Clavibacter sepedonicus]